MATRTRHFYSRAKPNRQPSSWWYYGRALYVSRRDYFIIYLYIFFGLGVPLVLAGWLLQCRFFLDVAFAVGGVALLYQFYSLLGMFRMYGPPALGYFRRLLDGAGVSGRVVVADLHVGTYRHSYALANLLPEATVHSIDCWEEPGRPKELAIADVRDLESAPTHHRRIHAARSVNHTLPLADASCDAVVFGFGTHEIPTGGAREALFREAKRVLKPGGKALIFEHGNDFHNTIVFGPVIGHVTRREEWMRVISEHFTDIHYSRTSFAVDLFWGTKADTTGVVIAPLPKTPAWLRLLGILSVVGWVGFLTFLLALALTGTNLYPILLGIAIAGLVLPWIGIGLMNFIDAALRLRCAHRWL